jgi:hypothetical protein
MTSAPVNESKDSHARRIPRWRFLRLCFAPSPRRGSDKKAQGNALGNRNDTGLRSPEGA